MVYHLGRLILKTAFFFCIKSRVIGQSQVPQQGGYLLACTHFSHTEPMCATFLLDRPVDWVTRIEFYRFKPIAWLLRAIDTIPVNRRGVSVKAIRTAIARAKAGRVVGVFPEGGVALGAESVCRGGPIKKGICMIACAAGVPIVPCVLLGTHKFNRMLPWLPIKQGKLWVAFGRPIEPLAAPRDRAFASLRRANRAAMALELQERFSLLYDELRQKYGIEDSSIP
ncbi:MAG: 1-acyl-sn-glycerol-3-phosphate acyltransferase [Planctomycetota bacterium]|nr:1-acyl-sn-glycerol-3-phosphate acyltransferase [Planctomycetota bacterium]